MSESRGAVGTAERGRTPRWQVAVCGPGHEATDEDERDAYRVGELLAQRGVVVICGGGRGVMGAVAAGTRAGQGLVVGIGADGDRAGTGPDLSVTIVTNMGEARNAIVVCSADAVIAVGGSWGTLSEMALAMRRGIPVVALHGWQVLDSDGRQLPGIAVAHDPAEAVDLALGALARR
jgi:uncharacterized protein (TIGR00725 family)